MVLRISERDAWQHHAIARLRHTPGDGAGLKVIRAEGKVRAMLFCAAHWNKKYGGRRKALLRLGPGHFIQGTVHAPSLISAAKFVKKRLQRTRREIS
jgi:hypothetical protein